MEKLVCCCFLWWQTCYLLSYNVSTGTGNLILSCWQGLYLRGWTGGQRKCSSSSVIEQRSWASLCWYFTHSCQMWSVYIRVITKSLYHQHNHFIMYQHLLDHQHDEDFSWIMTLKVTKCQNYNITYFFSPVCSPF